MIGPSYFLPVCKDKDIYTNLPSLTDFFPTFLRGSINSVEWGYGLSNYSFFYHLGTQEHNWVFVLYPLSSLL